MSRLDLDFHPIRRTSSAGAPQAQAVLEALFHGACDGIALVDAEGSVREVNAAAAAMFGLERPDARGRELVDLLGANQRSHPGVAPDMPWTQALGLDALGGSNEQTGRRSDGNAFPVALRLTRVNQADDAPYVATLRDLTDSRAADEAISMTIAEMDSATRRYEAMLRHAAFAIVLTNASGEIQALNPAARRLLGLDRTDRAAAPAADADWGPDGGLQVPVQGLDFERFIDRTDEASHSHPSAGVCGAGAGRWLTALGEADHVEHDVTLRRADGTTVPALLATSVLRDGAGRVEALLHMAYDITARRQQEASMRRLAYSDPLTGLGNRALLEQELQAALASAARQGRALCLLFIDLDFFKPINDAHGHAAGDAVLREVAARLQRVIRVGDLACRVGGDEFVVLLPAVRHAADGERVAAKLGAAIAAPIEYGERTLGVRASIGVVTAPQAGEDVASLMHAADLEMYRVKHASRSSGRPV